jgi:hypothetical protein
MANTSILYGSTPILPVTNHMSTNPTNHDSKKVCRKLNFFETINIAMAKANDQMPQTAPFMDSEGKTNPNSS